MPNAEKPPEREYIGVTPNLGLRIPRIDHKVEIEKDGYAPLERIASSAFIRAEFSSRHIHIEQPLRAATEAPEGMIFVPGGEYKLLSYGKPTTASAHLADFFIDKYEVSNAQLKAFIDASGYLKQKFWKYPFIKEGKSLSWQQAITSYRISSRPSF